jgi:hypothetical protein
MDNQNMPQNTAPQGSPSSMPPAGQPSGAPIPPQGEETKSVGALIGSIIIVIILIIGGFYLWSTKVSPVMEPSMMEGGMNDTMMNNEAATGDQASNEPDAVLNQMAAVDTSDDAAAIDADLKATNLDGLDSSLQAQ